MSGRGHNRPPRPPSYRGVYMHGRDDFELHEYRHRAFGVRQTNDEDIWFFGACERDMWRKLTEFFETITIVHFDSGRRWIFVDRTTNFPEGYRDTDAHAVARLCGGAR